MAAEGYGCKLVSSTNYKAFLSCFLFFFFSANLSNLTVRFNLSAPTLCLKVLVIKSRQLTRSMPEASAISYKNQHFWSRWDCLFVWLKIGCLGALQTGWGGKQKEQALTDKSWPIGVNKDNDQKQTWWVALIDKERSGMWECLFQRGYLIEDFQITKQTPERNLLSPSDC